MALTPPVLPRIRRICGEANVCVRPLTTLSAAVSSTEQGGDDAKGRGSNGRAVVVAEQPGSRSTMPRPTRGSTRVRERTQPRRPSQRNQRCRTCSQRHRPCDDNRRLPCASRCNDAHPQRQRTKISGKTDPQRPARTRRRAPAAARMRCPLDGPSGVPVGGRDDRSGCLRFFV